MLDRAEEKGYIVYMKVNFLTAEEVAESRKELREFLAKEDEPCIPQAIS